MLGGVRAPGRGGGQGGQAAVSKMTGRQALVGARGTAAALHARPVSASPLPVGHCSSRRFRSTRLPLQKGPQYYPQDGLYNKAK